MQSVSSKRTNNSPIISSYNDVPSTLRFETWISSHNYPGFTNVGQLEPHKSKLPKPAESYGTPGAGHYAGAGEAMDRSTKFKSRGTSAFGTYTAKRFNKAGMLQREVTPAPDEHPPRTTVGPSENSRMWNPVIPKFSKGYFKPKVHVTPGPSDYDTSKFRKKNVPTSTFGGETVKGDRFGGPGGFLPQGDQIRNPGPGRYGFVGQGIHINKAPGAPKMGTERRFPFDPRFIEIGRVEDASETAKRAVEMRDPGPGDYAIKSTMGKQHYGSIRSAPGIRFSARPKTRSGGEGQPSEADLRRKRMLEAKREKIRSATGPGPQSYVQPWQFGHQSNSRVRTAPQSKFGTSRRGGPIVTL